MRISLFLGGVLVLLSVPFVVGAEAFQAKTVPRQNTQATQAISKYPRVAACQKKYANTPKEEGKISALDSCLTNVTFALFQEVFNEIIQKGGVTNANVYISAGNVKVKEALAAAELVNLSYDSVSETVSRSLESLAFLTRAFHENGFDSTSYIRAAELLDEYVGYAHDIATKDKNIQRYPCKMIQESLIVADQVYIRHRLAWNSAKESRSGAMYQTKAEEYTDTDGEKK